MNDALERLNQAEKTFAAARALSPGMLDDLQALRQREFRHLPTAWHQAAIWTAAPVLAGFAQWMKEQAGDGRHLYIGVMREGRMLARLMNKLFGIEAREVWLNRNLSMLAAFGCGDDEALVNWLLRTRLAPITRGEALRGLLGEEYDASDSTDPITIETVGAFIERGKKSGIVDAARLRASALANRLLLHWQKICGAPLPLAGGAGGGQGGEAGWVNSTFHTDFLIHNDQEREGKQPPRPPLTPPASGRGVLSQKIFLMDFASAGNIQRSLQTIGAAKNVPFSLTGLNFCMTAGSRWAAARGCAMRGYLAEGGAPEWFAAAGARTPELMEIFTAEPCGSLLDYGEDGEPLCGASFLTTEQQPLIAELQEQILAAAAMYHRHLGKRLTADLARCLWGRLLLQPLTEEAEALAGWPLDAGLDGAARRVLAYGLSGSPASWSKMQTAWPAASALLFSSDLADKKEA